MIAAIRRYLATRRHAAKLERFQCMQRMYLKGELTR